MLAELALNTSRSDGEAHVWFLGDPRTCPRIAIAEAGPGAPELGVRARAEATAASATEWRDCSMTAAGQQLFAEYMFASGLASSWRLRATLSPWSRAKSARAERRRRHAAWAREGPYVCRVWECTSVGECLRKFADE